jgi:hypothetical protein
MLKFHFPLTRAFMETFNSRFISNSSSLIQYMAAFLLDSINNFPAIEYVELNVEFPHLARFEKSQRTPFPFFSSTMGVTVARLKPQRVNTLTHLFPLSKIGVSLMFVPYANSQTSSQGLVNDRRRDVTIFVGQHVVFEYLFLKVFDRRAQLVPRIQTSLCDFIPRGDLSGREDQPGCFIYQRKAEIDVI